MGGVNKGLVLLHDRSLTERVIERFQPQVSDLRISANRDLDAYRAFGFEVFPDVIEGSIGPLAGLHAALVSTRYPLVATVPCDSPFLPRDLVQRLLDALCGSGADIAVARTSEQLHPVFCLCWRYVVPHLEDFISSGGRRFMEWYDSRNGIAVSFDDEREAFRNINTTEELSGPLSRS